MVRIPEKTWLYYSLVSCGSIVKLRNVGNGFRVHSHAVTYGGSGSGQQSVTGFPNSDDANSLWVVKGPHGGSCKHSEPVKKGQTIRLLHATTGKYLHSHLHKSPLTKQQEVSAYGEKGTGDSGDNWKVEITTEHWTRGSPFRLKHEDTGYYLNANGKAGYGNPIPGQIEITCIPQKTPETEWVTEEGIYFAARK